MKKIFAILVAAICLFITTTSVFAGEKPEGKNPKDKEEKKGEETTKQPGD